MPPSVAVISSHYLRSGIQIRRYVVQPEAVRLSASRRPRDHCNRWHLLCSSRASVTATTSRRRFSRQHRYPGSTLPPRRASWRFLLHRRIASANRHHAGATCREGRRNDHCHQLGVSIAERAGNWIGVAIRAGQLNQTFAVSDSRGNTYRRAVQRNDTVDGTTLSLYYAENIASGANTISVSDSIGGGTLRLTVAEYSGVASVNSLDVSASAAGLEQSS